MAVVIDNVRIPLTPQLQMTGGPSFQTQITQNNGGWAYANANWQYALWDVTFQFVRESDEHQLLIAFWLARQGPAYAFLVDDPSDNTDNGGGAVIHTGGVYRLAKIYPDDVRPYTRLITRPKAGTVTLSGVAKSGGGYCTEADVDLTTGIIANATSTGTATFGFEFPARFTEDGFKYNYHPAQYAEVGQLKAEEVRV